MNKFASVSVGERVQVKLVGATIPDWQYIKGAGFQCWDNYVILEKDFTSFLLLTVRLNELGFKLTLVRL